MKLKIVFFVLLSIGLGIACLPQEKKTDTALLKLIVETTANNHLKPRVLNDSLSKEIFEFYLSQIDPDKSLLHQKDLQKLQSYQYSIDDEFKQASFQFFYQAQQILHAAIIKVEQYCIHILEQDIDLFVEESFETEAKKLAFTKDDTTLKDRWRKKIKIKVLEQLFTQENNTSNLNFSQRKQKAVAKVKEIYATQFKQLKEIESYQRRDQYLNAFLKVHDVQTEYLSRERKADWDAAYTRSFVGLGISLEIENAYPRISNLIIGGPAWKTKQLALGDIILSIAEDQQIGVDLSGKSMKEVLRLLKGKKGTKVQLKIKNSANEIKEISIIRDQIKFDLAMSFLLSEKTTAKQIGYIRLPRFYTGEEGSAYHVWEAIESLKSSNINGLIFDLRNNRGGSSGETRNIINYFLNEGFVMQLKYQNGEHRTFEDEDGQAIYDGKLIVLVNARSSSASELFSGTMQDYKRALIVGSTATYGKGTMQGFHSMDVMIDGQLQQLGEIKMSIGRFYTASGRSPQYHGIPSDIVLPDEDSYVLSGERIYEYSLANEDLPLTPCVQNVNTISNLEEIRTLSNQRITKNERFQLAKQKAYRIKEKQENSQLPLNYEAYKMLRENERVEEEKEREIFKEIPDFQVNLLAEELSLPDSSVLIQTKIPWQEQIRKDPYIYECYQIMKDLSA